MSSNSAGGLPIRTTTRKDWDKFVQEMFNRVIVGCRFGIGVVTVDRGMFSKKIKYFINQDFPEAGIDPYIRKNFNAGSFENIFKGGSGLVVDQANSLIKISGAGMGLPTNSLVALIENRSDRKLQALVIFGGSRMEGQLEARLASLDEFLGREASQTAAPASSGGISLPSYSELVAEIKKINTKRLFDYDLSDLARIANQIEEHRDELPRNLKPVYMKISKYVLDKRLRKK